MTLRPPTRGFSVSRRLSERARAAKADAAPADPTQAGASAGLPPGLPPGLPSGSIDFDIPGLGGLAGLAGTLRSLLAQAAAAAQSQAQAGTADNATPSDPAAHDAVGPHTRTVTLGSGNTRMVFGYTLRMGPDGLAAEPFGHVPSHVPHHVPSAGQSPDTATAAPVALQPIVEVFEDGAAVIVVAELPGADPDAIVCQPDGRRLLIEASGVRRYRKDLALPVPVQTEGLQQSYRNGILEVRLLRADAP